MKSYPVLACLVVLSALVWLDATQTTSLDAGSYVVEKNVMVPMRDDVRLATDIYRPARDGTPTSGKFPALLARTPYGKAGSATTAAFFTRHGYVVVVQDVRGRYDSEGSFYIYINEGRDGYDAVEWIAQQPWSNGAVGTSGGSYLAGTQNALAVLRPPHLKSMFVFVGTSNYYEDGRGRGGAFGLLHNVAYAFALASTSKEALADPTLRTALQQGPQQLGEWLRAYPYRNASPFQLVPAYDGWFQDWVKHADYDDYWKQNGYTFELYYDQYPDIPVYFVGGWYDLFLRGTLKNYSGLARRSTPSKKLLVGPWVHGVGGTTAGDVEFGPAAAVDIQLEQLRWFDAVLKGGSAEILREPPVRLFVMGGGGSRSKDGRINHGGQWRSEPAWPPPDVAPHRFYLHAVGDLRERLPDPSKPTVFTFDPAHPVPTIGGGIDSGKDLVPAGAFDQRCNQQIFGCRDSLPLTARRDVLAFQTPPLENDVEVTGPVTVTLWVASSAPDTDFTAKLVDVYPPSPDYPWGYAMNLADGIRRARYRSSAERAELLKPGAIYQMTIDLWGTSNRFTKGHRIRLDISSSNFPLFDVNPNTGEQLGHHTRLVSAVNSIYHDPEHPSYLLLQLRR